MSLPPALCTTLVFTALLTSATVAEDLCKQPSPEAMAKAAGVTLPPSPWHVANIWWDFQKPIEHFTSLEVDVTIDFRLVRSSKPFTL